MNKNIIFNLGFWLLLWLIFGFSIMQFESPLQSFRLGAIIIFPLIIPVYIHDYIFDYFILRKRYLLYFLCTAFLVFFFGYIISKLQDYLEPSGSSDTYGLLLIMMILFTGAKYFRIGTQQRLRIKEEEEKRIKAEMELKELEAKQAQAELNVLKSQVNPHFLFNSLNSIYSLILTKSEIAGDAVLKVSDLMRYLLESSNKRKVLVKHELEFLQNYIDLEKIRLSNKAEINYEFTGDYSGKIISPMLLIPFIENCFKHGISSISKQNEIDISINVENNTLILQTKNNKAPVPNKSLAKKESTGIENVKKRLELLYPQRHQLVIKNGKLVFQIKLTLDI